MRKKHRGIMVMDNKLSDKPNLRIISCGIIKSEIEAALGTTEKSPETSFLSPAPCIDYTKMKRQLELLLDSATAKNERVLVVIGKCHPEMDEILAKYGAKRANINDCFDAIIGEERKTLATECNTFFTTPAWLDHWKRAFSQGMKWDAVDARQNMGTNDRVLLLDTGLTPVTDEKILEYFDFVQVPVEVKSVDLSHFRSFLNKEIGTQNPAD